MPSSHPLDEYDLEAEHIAIALPAVASEDQLRDLMAEVFHRTLGGSDIWLETHRYTASAAEIWTIWQRHRDTPCSPSPWTTATTLRSL